MLFLSAILECTQLSPLDEDSQSEKMRKYRKQRTVFEADQLKALEDTFAVNAYPSSEEYESLAERISIDEARLRVSISINAN